MLNDKESLNGPDSVIPRGGMALEEPE